MKKEEIATLARFLRERIEIRRQHTEIDKYNLDFQSALEALLTEAFESGYEQRISEEKDEKRQALLDRLQEAEKLEMQVLAGKDNVISM